MFFGQIYGWIVIYRKTKDKVIPSGRGVPENIFSSSLNTVNLKIFRSHG